MGRQLFYQPQQTTGQGYVPDRPGNIVTWPFGETGLTSTTIQHVVVAAAQSCRSCLDGLEGPRRRCCLRIDILTHSHFFLFRSSTLMMVMTREVHRVLCYGRTTCYPCRRIRLDCLGTHKFAYEKLVPKNVVHTASYEHGRRR